MINKDKNANLIFTTYGAFAIQRCTLKWNNKGCYYVPLATPDTDSNSSCFHASGCLLRICLPVYWLSRISSGKNPVSSEYPQLKERNIWWCLLSLCWKSEIFHSIPTKFSNIQKWHELSCLCELTKGSLSCFPRAAQIPLKLYRAFWSCLQYLELPSNTKRAAGSKLNGRECGVWMTSTAGDAKKQQSWLTEFARHPQNNTSYS